MSLEPYNYYLPEEKIAKYPVSPRDNSKLLVFENQNIKDDFFYNLSDYIPNGTTLFFNKTKVIPARFFMQKPTGAIIEFFCLEPILNNLQYNVQIQHKSSIVWKCLIGNAKKWKDKELINKIEIDNNTIQLKAEKIKQDKNAFFVQFSWDNSSYGFIEILESIGNIPLPPYIKRKVELSDKETYQTIYASIQGSVAAPTAGLHFTERVFDKLQTKQITANYVVLHVGAGTFLPVKSDDIKKHTMHAEQIIVKRALIENLLKTIDNPYKIAVGTTSMRFLESIYWLGHLLYKNNHKLPNVIPQWIAYQEKDPITVKQALEEIIIYFEKNITTEIVIPSQIIIIPGYKFKIVNALITNFHQPKSTLLLLVSAFLGKNWKNIYQHALNNNYRFLSYGDSCLFFASK